MRQAMIRLLPIAALLGVTFALSCPSRVETKPNLLLVMVDTLRSDHLPSYGYRRMTAPYLQNLANEGIQLQGVSASSWTKPSIATLLTGLHPQRHQTNSETERLPEEITYLPDLLTQNGYQTGAYFSNVNASQPFGFARGYTQFYKGFDPEIPVESKAFLNARAPDKAHGSWVTEVGLHLADSLREPYFLYLHYLDPHDPYVPQRAWDGREDQFLQPNDLPDGGLGLSNAKTQRLIDQYDAAILEWDQQLEKLLSTLDQRGKLTNTLVVITSDHGEEFLEHGHLTHGKNLNEENLKVPLIFWKSKGLEPWQSFERFHQVDFLPTLLEALGLQSAQDLDGSSRWTEILRRNYKAPAEALYSLAFKPYFALAMRSETLKIHHQWQPLNRLATRPPINLLYDLQEDPSEQSPQPKVASHPQLLRRLVDQHNELSRNRFEGQSQPLNQEVVRELDALGYLGRPDRSNESLADHLPFRFFPWGSHPWALFGTDDPRSLQTRIDFSVPSSQLRHGFLPPQNYRAWSEPNASLVLRVPSEDTLVGFRGRLPDDRKSLTCSIFFQEELVETFKVPPGPFEWTIPLIHRPPNSLLYIDLKVDPPRNIEGRSRQLGLLFEEIGFRN